MSPEALKNLLIRLKPLRRWTRLIFGPIALTFLCYFGWRSRDTLVQVVAHAEVAPLLLSLGFWLASGFVAPVLALLLFNSRSRQLTYAQALMVHSRRLPARYIPGGVWQTVAKAVDFRALGISLRELSASIVHQMLIANATAFVLAGILLPAHYGFSAVGASATICGVLALVGVIAGWDITNRIIFGDRRYWKAGTLLRVTAAAAVSSTLLGAAFYSYLTAFPDQGLRDAGWWQIFGVFLFARGLGFVAFFAPRGIGVFEGIAAGMLVVPQEFASTAALFLGFRLVGLLGDALLWLGAVFASSLLSSTGNKGPLRKGAAPDEGHS